MRRVRSQFLQSVVRLGFVVVVVLGVGVALPGAALAVPKANLTSGGGFGLPTGSAGGQLVAGQVKGVAVNRSGAGGVPAGSVYVADGNANNRIQQFTASGQFVRTWGYDVIVAARPDSSVPPNSNGTAFEVCDVTNGNTAADCKGAAGLGAAAGQLANPAGVAVDQSNGYVYVTSNNNRRIDVFSPTGQFAGAFGWGADTGAAALEVCTTASGCQAPAAAGAQAGNFQSISNPATAAIDPSVPGRFYVGDNGNLRVAQYSTTIAGGVLTAATFDRAFGWGVDTGAAALESCTTASGCQVGTSGNGAGQFVTGASPTAVAVDGDGSIYVASGPLTNGTCSAATPCRIQKFAGDLSTVADFGPASGIGRLTRTADAANTVAALNLAVDPSNDHVFVLRKGVANRDAPTDAPTPSATAYQIVEYDSDGNYVETHPSGNALPATAPTVSHGLAVGTTGRLYTVYGSANTGVIILGPVPDPVPIMDSVTGVGSTTATFNGTVDIPSPGSPTFTTKYHFEYSRNGVDWASVPAEDQNVADGTTGSHGVTHAVTGLQPCTVYTARVVATTGNADVVSNTVGFTTDCVAPRVALTFVEEVTQTEAQLGAHIDPEGSATTYHFEWGDQPCSDVPNPCEQVPAFERQLGDGNSVMVAREPIDGLASAGTYHYRVIATNGEDETVGADETFETLNDCNLTDDRCYELVSPPNKGSDGAAGDVVVLGQELMFQASRDGGAIEYVMAYGMPDGTAGSEVPYLARRDSSGWSSEQIAAPAVIADDNFSASTPSRALGLSADLSCGVFASLQPLGDNPPVEALQTGVSALYRRDLVGQWTAVTDEVSPVASGEPHTAFKLIGVSQSVSGGECDRIVFRTGYKYPSVQGSAEPEIPWLYRWDGVGLAYVGVIPGPGGPEVARTIAGAPMKPDNPQTWTAGGTSNYWNAVSADGSRVYFTAVSRLGGDLGQDAVFLDEVGSPVAVDVSQSQTAALAGGVANNDDSTYQVASADGSQVFFTARYGLASNADGTVVQSSSGPSSCDIDGRGCDLYRYSVETGKLTDVSADTNPADAAGAGVVGVLGASDDGEYVYFAARGQLEPGKGSTEAQNLANDTYGIYVAHDGTVRYVGRAVNEGPEIDNGGRQSRLLIRGSVSGWWNSRVTPDGRHLLFQTQENLTDYDSGGLPAAYLYSFDDDAVVCVSCRRDGQPPVPYTNKNGDSVPLQDGLGVANSFSPPLTLTDDGRRMFFMSYDRLAQGATAGKRNLYQWDEGQITFMAASAPGTTGLDLRFAGASSTGDDVYFTSVDHYSWEDFDSKLDVYDARVGGGFDEPPAPPQPCDPLTEGSCGQGDGASGVGSLVDTDAGGSDGQGPVRRAVLSLGRLSKGQLARLAGGRRVGLAVRVSRPGRVSVRGVASIGGLRARVISASRDVTAAGKATVPMVLSAAARRRLASAGLLKVTLRVGLAGAARDSVRTLVFRTAKANNNDRGRSRLRRADNDRRAGQ